MARTYNKTRKIGTRRGDQCRLAKAEKFAKFKRRKKIDLAAEVAESMSIIGALESQGWAGPPYPRIVTFASARPEGVYVQDTFYPN